MGLPIIQIYMIVARQLSKPITGYFMKLGREHPAFRSRFLIPLGKAMANLSTKLRMKNLGLGTPTTVANISDETALEQASEVIHQVAIFGYTVMLYVVYTNFTHKTEKEVAYAEDVQEVEKKLNQEITGLKLTCLEMEEQIRALKRERERSWFNSILGPKGSSPSVNPMEKRSNESTSNSNPTNESNPMQSPMPKTTNNSSDNQQRQLHASKTISRTEAMERLVTFEATDNNS